VNDSLYELTSPDVQDALARSPTVVIPFGSVEQHGPHLPCGTDMMVAELIARSLAEQLNALYVPFSPYGITPIHSGYPGTISLRRETFEALLSDVCGELIQMGAERFVLVNWHEGNTPALNAVSTGLQAQRNARFYVAQACYVAQRIYRDRGGRLSHGGGIETLAILAHDAGLLRLDRVQDEMGDERVDEMRRGREVYGFVTDARELSKHGWYGNPSWATPELAETFAESVVAEIVTQLERFGIAGGREPSDRRFGKPGLSPATGESCSGPVQWRDRRGHQHARGAPGRRRQT
jgi:creatinine amidohydrolase